MLYVAIVNKLLYRPSVMHVNKT